MKGVISDYEESAGIRNTYSVLPFQGIWTWLTGREMAGRKTLWRSNSTEMICWALSWVVGGSLLIILSLPGLSNNHWDALIYIVGALLSASGARYVVATIIHHGVHGHLYKSQILNKIICEILSTLFVVQPYASYRQFHVYEHHGKKFSTIEDKDLAAIYKLGFVPGKSKSALYLNLFVKLFSPFFHLSFLYGRIKSNLIGVPLYRFAMSTLWIGILASIAWFYGVGVFCLLVVVPLVFVYQAASLLHLLTEHVWLLRGKDETVRDSRIKNCHGRFCGTPCPSSFTIAKVPQWFTWIVAHLFYHLPVRMLVVQGSLVCHDWHHRYGSVRQWFDYAALREASAQKLLREDKYDYIDIWGLHNCLNYVFEMISASTKVDVDHLEYRLN
ncbi:fatty acid desaturase [Pseudomonas sp. NPDC087614]|uniref:fatty acid desaturase n=1 Tax=Pseudomonas sp. NPDC087614 TaxID=3364442 RepID=UPI00380C2C91